MIIIFTLFMTIVVGMAFGYLIYCAFGLFAFFAVEDKRSASEARHDLVGIVIALVIIAVVFEFGK